MSKHIDFGKFIAYHRIKSGFKSQRQLADKTGISSATISRIESGIQRPNADTLKVLSQYLHTTSLVELMVVCGYWDEDELLEPINVENQGSESPAHYQNEQEFLNELELTDEELLKKYKITLDGKPLTIDEAKGVIAYLRSLRQLGIPTETQK
ncbi:helix-turn-helix domain-containing protein [Parageobacillus thermoglucosidasius]|uniref:helix-turn-helix domain-containing protein n=1 Tax=Parageobacillus thermoglucosidasius TaxID=1426 RepID=UPI000B573A72|nr:helix-turn-helix transcriptional regulator [Parageobacillus thermoglucosidasius]OUM93306.1 MAG: hypothetical protein BAA00_15670 [Parageobacillus thermoglucosidasius]